MLKKMYQELLKSPGKAVQFMKQFSADEFRNLLSLTDRLKSIFEHKASDMKEENAVESESSSSSLSDASSEN